MDLGDIIRSRRNAIGLSQTELAKAAGVHVRQIARYEAGEQQPALPVAVALADALGISIAQLAGQVSYELDLSSKNAEKLRSALAKYVASARRVRGARRGRNGSRASKSSSVDLATVREWARANGFEVSDRGRVAGVAGVEASAQRPLQGLEHRLVRRPGGEGDTHAVGREQPGAARADAPGYSDCSALAR